jgi:hypothetical protein
MRKRPSRCTRPAPRWCTCNLSWFGPGEPRWWWAGRRRDYLLRPGLRWPCSRRYAEIPARWERLWGYPLAVLKRKADKGKEKVGESPKRPWLELQVQELRSILSGTRGSFPRPSFLGPRNLDASVHPVAQGGSPKRVPGSGPEENAPVTTVACLNNPPPF